MYPLTYDNNGKRHLRFHEGVKYMREETIVDFPIEGDRSLSWLYQFTVDHGGTFDGRHTKWTTELRIDHDSAAYHIHDMLGFALDLAVTWDQLDAVNLACLEVIGRAYMLVEETSGTMKIEGIEHYKGRDVSGSLRRGIALAPKLAKHTTDKLSQQTEIMKQRRKAREEIFASKGRGRGGGRGQGAEAAQSPQ